jgi:hypothetical protein
MLIEHIGIGSVTTMVLKDGLVHVDVIWILNSKYPKTKNKQYSTQRGRYENVDFSSLKCYKKAL